jgi:hypothetical protein
MMDDEQNSSAKGEAMKEQEMRLRVFRFLRARMRNMIMPATMGLGLAIGGCTTSSATPVYSGQFPDDAAATKSDILGADSVAQGPDLAVADTRDTRAGEDVVKDSAHDVLAVEDVAGDAADAENDSQRDALAIVDHPAGSDGVSIDSAIADGLAKVDADTDLDAIVTKYLTPFFDAATVDSPADLGLIARYHAPMPKETIGNEVLKIRYNDPDA